MSTKFHNCKSYSMSEIELYTRVDEKIDLDLHCLSLSMWICINNLHQVIWMAEDLEVGGVS